MFRHRSVERSSRGQGMVEFALVLPLLVLLLLLAVDFGRVFFGWVGLQNAARIGANYAAQFPTADWADPSDPRRAEYLAQIGADAAAINCALPATLPIPTFPDGTAPGDRAVVGLTCNFSIITPFIAAVTGNPIELNAESTFPIRAGLVSTPGGGPPPPPPACAVVPDMVGGTVADGRSAWRSRGFSPTAFSPASGSDTDRVTRQDTTPSSTPGATCLVLTASVVVQHVPAGTCIPGELKVPLLIGRTVGDARDIWTSTFTGSFSPNGQNNAYVTAQNPAADTCQPSNATMTVTPGPAPTPMPCTAPDFTNKSTTEAPGWYYGAVPPFTGTIHYVGARQPFVVTRQSLVAGLEYACTTDVTLRP
jgi:Flp pilus assembly protein TadG